MIILLQKEINIVPGRQMPVRPPDTQIGENCAVLQIINNTNQENEYTIRVECAAHGWRDEWLRVASIAEVGDGGSYSQPSKPDMALSDGSLRIYVARQSQRKVLLAFHLPKAPDSRAGRYPLTVSVRTRITAGSQSPQVEELRINAFVEPYYEWGLTFDPPKRGVGLFRRRAAFEVMVVNRGNDWLYCQLRPPQAQQQAEMRVALLSEAVAVPPPDQDQSESVRRVPLLAQTLIKQVRGGEKALPILLRAYRIDAPSVPQIPQQNYGAVEVQRPDHVLSTITNEPPNIVDETFQVGTLAYYPLVRSFVTGSVKWVVDNIKAAMMALVGILFFLVLMNIVWQAFVRDMRVEPLVGRVTESDRIVPFKGRYTQGATVYVYTKSGSISANNPTKLNGVKYGEDAKNKAKKSEGHAPATAQSVINQLNVTNPQYVVADLDEIWDDLKRGDKLRFKIVRGSIFARLVKGWLTYECNTVIDVEKKAEAQPLAAPALLKAYWPPVEAGKSATITGSRLGSGGAITVDGRDMQIMKWGDAAITFKVPADMEEAKKGVLEVMRDDGQVVSGSIDIKANPSLVVAGGGDSPPTGGGGGDAGGCRYPPAPSDGRRPPPGRRPVVSGRNRRRGYGRRSLPSLHPCPTPVSAVLRGAPSPVPLP